MHPTRDEPVFLAIADILGFDPFTRTVSCPIMQNGSVWEEVRWDHRSSFRLLGRFWRHYK